MKKLDLLPTDENIYNTFINDSIGRNKDLVSFLQLINLIDGSYSIAVDGAWGSGKTFFVKQLKMILDSLNPDNPLSKNDSGKKVVEKWNKIRKTKNEDNKIYVTAYYDAWSHDDEEDPLLSLVYSIILDNPYLYNDSSIRDWTDILSKLSDVVTGRSISDFINALRGKEIFEKPQKAKEIKDIINNFLKTIILSNNSKLVIIIDELDRCSPLYAIKLLERIKHYIQDDSIIFVFSINQIELQKTIKSFYGSDFDACRYLDRFFDFRYNLSEVDIIKYMHSLGMFETNNLREATCFEFIKQSNMSLREISKYIIATIMATYSVTDSDNSYDTRISQYDGGYSFLFSFSVIVPIAIGLRITNINSYNDFINGHDEEWLIRILLSYKIFNWVFQYLFDDKNNKVDIDKLTEEQKHNVIKKLYYAIFIKDYDEDMTFRTEVGKVIVDKNTKNSIVEAVNFSSKYTSLIV